MKYIPFERSVHYYETDQMGIVHHSNYIRWFEECRTDFLNQFGVAYHELEAQGVMIPVISASCEYKTPAKFAEHIRILPKITFFNGARMVISYRVENAETGVLHCIGETGHCFVNSSDFKPIRLKKIMPQCAELLASLLEVDLYKIQ